MTILTGCFKPSEENNYTSGTVTTAAKGEDNVARDVTNVLILKSFDELGEFVSLSTASDSEKTEYLRNIDEMQTGIRSTADIGTAAEKLSVPTYIRINSESVQVASIMYYPEYDYVDMTYHEDDSLYWNIRIISYMHKIDGTLEFEDGAFTVGDLTFRQFKSSDEKHVYYICTDTEYPVIISAISEMENWCLNNLSKYADIVNFS